MYGLAGASPLRIVGSGRRRPGLPEQEYVVAPSGWRYGLAQEGVGGAFRGLGASSQLGAHRVSTPRTQGGRKDLRPFPSPLFTRGRMLSPTRLHRRPPRVPDATAGPCFTWRDKTGATLP